MRVLVAFLKAADMQAGPELARLTKEAGELLAIFAASLSTAKRNRKRVLLATRTITRPR